jgi:hypothetical protein
MLLTDDECTRIYNEANGITTKNPPISTERIFKAMRQAYAQGAASQLAEKPVAWLDDFGNAFPLGANKGAGSWMDAHKRTWKELFTRKEQK